MGTGGTLHCDACGYNIQYTEGIGMRHALTCERILNEMKLGKYGEIFQKHSIELSHPSIHFEYALFHCKKCGNLLSDEILEICNVDEDSLKNPVAYAHLHTSVYKKPHICNLCLSEEMEPLNLSDNIVVRCPRCNLPLSKRLTVLWD